jgi:polysaccharide export outer membrane protein
MPVRFIGTFASSRSPRDRSAPVPRFALGCGLILAISLTGCSLPRSGPSAGEFTRSAQDGAIHLVDATSADAASSQQADPATGFSAAWQAVPPINSDIIGVGDTLDITIFERDGLNMFPAGQDGASHLVGIPVEAGGAVQIPYVGSVAAAGSSPADVRSAVLRRLRRLALSSDVTVAISGRHSQLVSVQGDVSKPGMVPLGPETRRLTSLLSMAAPTPANLEQAVVTVRRGAQATSLRLSDVFEQPAQDIALRAGDVVIVRNVVSAVNVLGAAGLQGRVRITKRAYSVVDAVADARGLNDAAANAGAVYLMRLSNPDLLTAAAPTVYHFDFRDPAEIAIAARFVVHDGDAVLIANAPFAQSSKVLTAFSGVLNTARSAAAIAP